MEENRSKTELTGKEKRLANLKRDAGPGRPPGQRDYKTIYREAMIILASNNSTTPEKLEAEMVANGFMAARKGDYRFYKDTLDRLHGTAPQTVNVTADLNIIFDDSFKPDDIT
jgi:hypothetical protein